MAISQSEGVVSIASVQPHIQVSIINRPGLDINNINNKYEKVITSSKVSVLNLQLKNLQHIILESL